MASQSQIKIAHQKSYTTDGLLKLGASSKITAFHESSQNDLLALGFNTGELVVYRPRLLGNTSAAESGSLVALKATEDRHAGEIRCFATGKVKKNWFLFSGSCDRTICIWDPLMQKEEEDFRPTRIYCNGSVLCLAIANETLFSSDHNALRIWVPKLNSVRHTLKLTWQQNQVVRFHDWIPAIATNLDASKLIIGDYKGVLHLFDKKYDGNYVETKKERFTKLGITKICRREEEGDIIMITSDARLNIVDSLARPLFGFDLSPEVMTGLAVAGKMMFFSTKTGYIQIWDLRTYNCVKIVRLKMHEITNISVHQITDGKQRKGFRKFILYISIPEGIERFLVEETRHEYKESMGHTDGIIALKTRPAALAKRQKTFWDNMGEKEAQMLTKGEEATKLQIDDSADDYLFSAGMDNTIIQWRILIKQGAAKIDKISSIPFGPNIAEISALCSIPDMLLVSGHQNGDLICVNLESLSKTKLPRPPSVKTKRAPIAEIVYSIGHKQLVSLGIGGEMLIYQYESGPIIKSRLQLLKHIDLQAETLCLKSVSVANESFVLVGAMDGNIFLKDIVTHRVLNITHPKVKHDITAIACDGDIIIAGTYEGNLIMWAIETDTHLRDVNCLAVSENKKSFQLLRIMEGIHAKTVRFMTMLSNGVLLSVSEDSIVQCDYVSGKVESKVPTNSQVLVANIVKDLVFMGTREGTLVQGPLLFESRRVSNRQSVTVNNLSEDENDENKTPNITRW